MSSTKPPSHLSTGSRQLWESVVDAYALEEHHRRLLLAACESWDRAETCRRAVAREGLVQTDRFGMPRTHPAADLERKARSEFRAHLRELGLDVAPAGEVRGPAAPTNANLRVS